jgi:hypothetical protein
MIFVEKVLTENPGSSGIKVGLTSFSDCEYHHGQSEEQEWLRELEEINQTIQTKNVELRRLLQESDEEKRKL